MKSLETQYIKAEVRQRREEGCDIGDISDRVDAALEAKAGQLEMTALYDELMSLPVDESFPYIEPSTLDAIRAERYEGERKLEVPYGDDVLYDRIYGAWLGRAAGCALGKPVEGWKKEQIDKFLKETDSLPLDNYLPFREKWISKTQKASTLGNIEFMDRDDDMDYPILGLLALERHGARLTSRGMAYIWLQNIPFGTVYTAEDSAYRNLVMNIFPPNSAIYRNPFREWIGAQIRADIFGYAAPGWPEKAAELAFYDAAISHDKNGIYGEMFVAAMVSAAFVHTGAEEIIVAGLAEIPAESRLAEAVRDTLVWCKEEDDWLVVWEKINESLGHYHGVHTINNAALVVMGVWYGVEDFETGIVKTVRGGWDTDCTGATVGSILGARLGAASLPDKWVGVFNDRLKSVVSGHSDNKISDLARRTLDVSKIVMSPVREKEKVKLGANVGGVWELNSKWGKQVLDFGQGTIDFINQSWRGVDDKPMDLWSCEYTNPHMSFSYGVDKGGWDYCIDFSGTVDGDHFEGFYYPGVIPVSGTRKVNI